MSPRPLAPAEMFPARAPEVDARFVALSTGISVRIATAGPTSGPPVLMLPGWGGSLYMYRHALSMLPHYGFRIIAVDLRGMGLADKPRAPGSYSLNTYLADLQALLDALGIERAALVGQSMGGAIALHYALRSPERVARLALVNPAGLVRIGVIPLARLAPRPLLAALGRRAIPRWLISFILRRIAYANGSRVMSQDIEEYWAPTQLEGYMYGLRSALTEFDWTPLPDAMAAGLTIPTMVILGNEDRLIRNTTASAARFANSRVWCTLGGHCVHEEHPNTVYTELARFLHEPGERYH